MKYFLSVLMMAGMLLPGASSQTVKVVTEEWAPFNYTLEGRVTGISTTLVKSVLENAGITYTLRSYPWARAYDMALKDPDILIYTIAKTPEREPLFHWIGPFFTRTINLYKLRSRPEITVSDFDDLKKYSIPVSLSNAVRSELLRRGYPESKIQTVTGENSAVLMLLLGRVDLLAGNPLVLKHQLQSPELRGKISWSDLEEVYPLIRQEGYYMAYSRVTPQGVVDRTREAFSALHSQGYADRLMKEYLGSDQKD